MKQKRYVADPTARIMAAGNAKQLAQSAQNEIGKLRIILASDMHNGSYDGQGLTYSQRMDLLVQKINEENKTKPIDLVLFLGDNSHNNSTLPSYDSLADVVGNKLTGLAAPFYCLHGSHDYYTEAQWVSLFGYSKRYTISVGPYVFLCVDTFGDSENIVANSGFGYTKIDSTWLAEQLSLYADKKIFLCAHYIDETKEDSYTLTILNNASNLVCAFEGHVHDYVSRQLPGTDVTVYRAGNFSYPPSYDWNSGNLWGYRVVEVTGTDVETYGVKVAHTYDAGAQVREELTHATIDTLSLPNNPTDISASIKDSVSRIFKNIIGQNAALKFMASFENAIKNSIFVRGPAGWGATNSVASVVDGRLVSTGTGGANSAQVHYETALSAPSKQWYVSGIMSTPDAIAVNAELRIQGTTGGASLLIGNKSNPSVGVNYPVSGVVTTDATSTGVLRLILRGNYANATVATGARLSLERPMVVDITNLSAEKKTKVWCDENLKYRV